MKIHSVLNTALYGGLLLAGSLLPSRAAAQWPCNPSAGPTWGFPTSVIAATSDGGAFTTVSGSSIGLQRLDPEGRELLPAGGVPVADGALGSLSNLAVDAADRAVLAVGLTAFAFDSGGASLFGPSGIALSDSGGVGPAVVTVLPSGDYAFLWREPVGNGGTLHLQRVSSAGTPGFPLGGVLLDTADTQPYDDPSYVVQPNGDLVVAWTAYSSGTGTSRVRAQRYSSATGAPVWAQPTVVVAAPAFGAVQIANLTIVADGGGGAYLAWNRRDPASFDYLQHLDANGVELMAAGGRALHDMLTDPLPVLAADRPVLAVDDATGDVLAFVTGQDGGIAAQRYDAQGAPQWLVSGQFSFPVLLALPGLPFLQTSFAHAWQGGAIVGWWDGDPATHGLVLHRIDGAGNSVWPTGSVVASTGVGNAFSVQATLDGAGRTLTNLGTAVTAAGELGGPPLSPYCAPSPTGAGCAPALATSGPLSASDPAPFLILASGVPSQRAALFFYGTNGRTALPFGDGTLCVTPPLRRTPLLQSGGSSAASCTGALVFDLKGWMLSGVDPYLSPGETLNGQFQVRDPGNPSGFATTGGIELYACP